MIRQNTYECRECHQCRNNVTGIRHLGKHNSRFRSWTVGPVSYVISASALSTVTTGNSMHKYADDIYIVIPARNAYSREAELDHVAEWARNNLKLNPNRVKCVEIIFEDRSVNQSQL